MRDCHGQDEPARPAWARLLWPSSPPRADAGADMAPSPGVESMLGALRAAEPDAGAITHALAVYAWERAAACPDLTCALDDIDDLWNLLESAGPVPVSRSEARHSLVDAWVDAVAADRGSPGVDPLSGLHTAGYLYGRVHELDRLAGDTPADLVLLVVRWPEAAGPWLRIAHVMQVASALRTQVRPTATLSQVGTTMAVALVPDDAQARVERHALTKAFESDELCTAQVQVDVFAVPDVRSHLPKLVTQLHEQASLDHVTGTPSSRHTGTGHLD